MADDEQDPSRRDGRGNGLHRTTADASDVSTTEDGEESDAEGGGDSVDCIAVDGTYQPRCDFGAVCASGCETYRKIISHIFGRNKMCTRLIPDDAWVYFCRKHYQRIRFRTDTTWWPNTQCELVKTMLERLEASGEAVGLDLALRARETQRLKEAEEASRDPQSVRRFERNASNNAKRTGTSTSKKKRKPPIDIPAPVPVWLRQLVGPNKTFHEVRAIIDRIQADIIAQICRRTEGNTGTPRAATGITPDIGAGENEEGLFPDIEILPRFKAEWSKARKRQLNEKAALSRLHDRLAAQQQPIRAALIANAEAETNNAPARAWTDATTASAREKRTSKCSRVSKIGAVQKVMPTGNSTIPQQALMRYPIRSRTR